jgi:hypothetical protein
MDEKTRSESGARQQREDQDRPNQNANKEPAEGSRETVRGNQTGRDTDDAGGITNRPLHREAEEQEQVPPRGQSKDEERGNA